jgi:signal peptidase II
VEGVAILNADPGTTNPDARRAIGPASFVALVAAILVLDQATKFVVASWLGPGAESRRWELAGRFLAFEYVENTGAAFGILAGQTWLLAALAVAVGGWFLAFHWRQVGGNRAVGFAVALIAGGALGNLIDRIRLGYVVDFVAVGTWPRFNVSDSAITIGVMILGYTILRDDRTGSIDD